MADKKEKAKETAKKLAETVSKGSKIAAEKTQKAMPTYRLWPIC